MADEPPDSDTRVARLLAYATLHPALRGILCFDRDPEDVLEIAADLAEVVRLVEGPPVAHFVLSSRSDEDGLWTRIGWETREGTIALRLLPGPLAPPEDGSTSTIVVIPDLTRLSLPAARACVMLIGADVANLERHGRSAQWLPNHYWIAACPSDHIGAVSPHLLDRFAIRVNAAERSGRDAQVEAVIAAAAGSRVGSHSRRRRPLECVDVEKALAARPRLTAEATNRLLAIGVAGTAGMRREIAAARASVAEARLAGHERVGAADVERAIQVLQLETRSEEHATPAEPELAIDVPPAAEAAPEPQAARTPPPQPATTEATGARVPVDEPILAADTRSALEPSRPAPGGGTAYPEDDAPVERDAEPLRFPQRQRGGATVPRGTIVGIEPATDLRDIAVLPSVVEALKLQPARRRVRREAGRQLLFGPGDLRSYIRAPAPETMLALLLDYTCRGNWEWTAALTPFLRWAYIHRANMSIAKVGARDAASEFRAEHIRARSLLDPRVSSSLNAAPGTATPLAHGLHLILHSLLHELHHGTGAVQEAWLVVVTDGRGNVPLEASIGGRAPRSVGRRGIDDALDVAKRISTLDRLRIAVIDPEPTHSPDLPHGLARALGATVCPRSAGAVADVA